MNRGVLIFILVATLCISRSVQLSCLPCDKNLSCEKDESALDCEYGTGKGPCNCCAVCLKGPGEDCGGAWNVLGNCGRGHACLDGKGNPVGFNGRGTCQQRAITFN